jgi:cytochrome c2
MNLPRPHYLILIALALTACAPKIKFSPPSPTPAADATPTTAAIVLPADPVGTDLNVELPQGDAANGELLFNGQINGQYPCLACHSLEPGSALVGPSLGTIATTAAARKDGYTAELYIHESIVSPNAYVVEGFNQGIMPQTFAAQMTKQDLADLIAFLMTKK